MPTPMARGENNPIMPSIPFCNLNGKPTAARLMYFKLQKFTSQNLVYQAAVFFVRNVLKVTNGHLRFEKFFRRLYPGPPLEGEGGHREGKEGKAREDREREGGEG
jgi:hypothetical protein